MSVDVVDASLDLVWATIADLEQMPNYLTTVSSVHRTGDLSKQWQEGTTWRETRVVKNEGAVVLAKTITAMSTDEKDGSRSVSIHVGFNHSKYSDATNTSTLSVYPVSESQCRLVGALAVVVPGCFAPMKFLLCGRCMRGYVSESFEVELQEIAAEAEKRQKGQGVTCKEEDVGN